MKRRLWVVLWGAVIVWLIATTIIAIDERISKREADWKANRVTVKQEIPYNTVKHERKIH